MDPLSIIASTITVAGVVAAGLEYARTLENAGREVHLLINEVSDIRIVLMEIESAIRSRLHHQRLPHGSDESMCKLLSSAKHNLQQLDDVIKNQLKFCRSSKGQVKVARLAWFRQKSRIGSILEELRRTRTNLSAVCGASSL